MFKCITLNVNGIAEQKKRDVIFDFLRQYDSDIYFLQETHSANVSDEAKWTIEWGGKGIWNHGSHHSCGVAILLNPKIDGTFTNIQKDKDGRLISTKVTVKDSDYSLINIYAPNKPYERKIFFENIWQYKPGIQNMIVGGDFNCVADLLLDKQGGNPLSGNEGIIEFDYFKKSNTLRDSWRETHAQDRIFTWSNKDYTIRSRLDRFYIDTELHSTAISSIRSCPYSDHSVVEICVNPTNANKRGRGVWKLNNSILPDRAFQREIRVFHKFWVSKKSDFPTIHDWWDEGKSTYKRIAISYAVKKQRQQRMQENALLNKLSILRQEQHPDVNKIKQLEQELRQIVQKRLDGAKIRSRVKWLEEGEMPSRYFFDLEHKRQTAARISTLDTPSGKIDKDSDILHEAQRFYQTLYNDEPVDRALQDQLLDQLERKLTYADRQSCEGPITRPEIDAAIKKMNVNKAPGADGLTTEFYKTFWRELADDLCEIYNFAFEGESLANSQRESILRLLFKKGERCNLKNWRPIALLNTDYKILATVMATRLRPTLASVIQEHQSCGIPGRTIFDSVLTLRDIVSDVNIRKAKGILISIDQEKAFDRVNRDLLDRILEKFNYGPSFRRWIKTLYAGANCRVINNGHLSEPILLRRGVRQGCPLSPLLYIFAIEILLMSIQHNKHIRGIETPGYTYRHRVTAYADDATLTLKDDSSVAYAFDQIHVYEKASGSKLNMTKTEGLYIGEHAGKTTGPVPITWKSDSLKILGCKIGNDMRQDWDKALDKLRNKLANWQKRNITICGKTTLIKAYGLAGITYLASVFPLPESVALQLHKVIFTFLWNHRNELVTRETCHLPKTNGGLAIPNLTLHAKALQTKWLRMVIDKEYTARWVGYARYWTGFSVGLMKDEWAWLRSNLVPHGDPNSIPKWYAVMLQGIKQIGSQVVNIDEGNITTKTLTNLMAQHNDPRCVKEWKKYVRPPLDMTKIWSLLWTSYVDNKGKEILWKLSHRVLTTKCYLSSWGMNIDTKCPFCNKREDMHHALIGCHRCHTAWEQMQRLLQKIAGSTIPINLQTIGLGMNLPTNEEAKHLSYYLMGTLASTIWQSRNKKVLNKNTRELDLYTKTLMSVRYRLQLEEMINPSRLDYVWSYRDVICSRKDGKTVMII